MRLLTSYLLTLSLLFLACQPEFNVVAEAEEIRVVIGVLNPEDSVQYVRVSKGFLVQGDALLYADTADLTWPGQNVILRGDNGQTVLGYPVTNIPRDSGVFNPSQVLYKFITDGSGPTRGKLIHGVRYKLEIGAPEDPEFITGETTIPLIPQLRGTLLIQDGAGTLNCLPKFDLRYPLQITWIPVNALAYELRVKFRYKQNFVDDSIIYGPTSFIYGNEGCTDGHDRICYKIPARELLNYYKDRMPQHGFIYSYETKDTCVPNPHNNPAIDSTMPRSFEFELTAVDTNLTHYMEVNSAANLELTAAKPEFTNLKGKVRCVGVFGSISMDHKYATLSLCTENILNLNDRPILQDCQ